MRVESHGRGVFLVTNQRDTHTVDTLANRGAGQCDCWPYLNDIRHRVQEARQHGHFKPEEARWKCPHILAADAELLQQFKRELMKQFPDNDQSKHP